MSLRTRMTRLVTVAAVRADPFLSPLHFAADAAVLPLPAQLLGLCAGSDRDSWPVTRASAGGRGGLLRCHPITWLGGSSGFDPVPRTSSRVNRHERQQQQSVPRHRAVGAGAVRLAIFRRRAADEGRTGAAGRAGAAGKDAAASRGGAAPNVPGMAAIDRAPDARGGAEGRRRARGDRHADGGRLDRCSRARASTICA